MNDTDDYFSSNDEDISSFNIDDNIIKNLENASIISLKARELVQTSNWCFNREINKERVKELYEQYITNNSKNNITQPIWIFQAIYDVKGDNDSNKLYILDGQHRKQVLNMYLMEYDDDMIYDKEFICIIYKIDYCESINKKIAIELFKKINNNRQFRDDELPDDFITELIDIMACDNVLKYGIKIKDITETAHEPCIHKKELNTFFNLHKDKIKNMTHEEIVSNIKKINNKLSLKDYSDLYGNKCKKKETYHNKAHKYKFYLNLKSSKYPLNVWINFIENPCEI